MPTDTDATDGISPEEVAALIKHFGEDPDHPHLCVPVAGLQYYDYDETDEMLGQLRPNIGDRLELMRRPDNPYDSNAIEVRWRNGQFHLGHLPRHYAEAIAPLIDCGQSVRAYALNSGNGDPWSFWTLVISSTLPTSVS